MLSKGIKLKNKILCFIDVKFDERIIKGFLNFICLKVF